MTKTSCSVDGCSNPARQRGWCLKHYNHWREWGDPEKSETPTKSCTIDGCEAPQFARGWCRKHAQRWHRHGTTDDPRVKTRSERFWGRVDKSQGPDACWPWLGAINRGTGYGVFGKESAHRAAYELVIGPIPDGLHLDHVRKRGCTRRDCVNPAHLEPVTSRENNLRGDSPAAVNATKTHCKNGHLLAGDNLYVMPSGNRACKECRREANRRHRASQRAS